MAKSIPAIVTPEVLQWARSLDRITLEEIALKLKVEVAKVEAWENGSEYPSLIQAKNLAKQSVDVKRFLAIVKKYTDLTELTPEILREFIDKIIVHAPDKSSGRRLQEIEIIYNHIGEFDRSKVTLWKGNAV